MPAPARACALLVALLLSLPASQADAQYLKKEWPARTSLPGLSLADQHGKVWDWAALKGHTVLINFWATWCGPCKEELPSLQLLAEQQRPKGVIVLTVNVKEPPARALDYAEKSGLNLPVLMDPKGELTRRFGVSIYPTTLLINASGKPRWLVLGALDWAEPKVADWLRE